MAADKRTQARHHSEIIADRCQRSFSPQVPSGMEANKSSPAVPAPSMGWDEGKHPPQNGFNTETAGASWRERHSPRESFNSLPSEGESVDVQPGSVGEQLFYVQQLRERMTKEQVEMRALIRCVFYMATVLPGSL